MQNRCIIKYQRSPQNRVYSVQADIPKGSVCKHYLRKNCLFGKKGLSCPKAHPGICFKYVRGKCSEAIKKCKYWHPEICTETDCARKECHKYHTNVRRTRTKHLSGRVGYKTMGENKYKGNFNLNREYNRKDYRNTMPNRNVNYYRHEPYNNQFNKKEGLGFMEMFQMMCNIYQTGMKRK